MRVSALSAALTAFLIGIGLVGAAPSSATVNLVSNGNFETTTLSGSNGFGDRYATNQVANWSTDGYSFVFAPGQADTVGAEGERGHVWLWGPDYAYGNGASANGLPDTSPTGGNFIGADGAYEAAPISQMISGLQAGTRYQLDFYWAAAQQMGYNGTTQQNWTVSLGNQTFETATVTNPSHGFTAWQEASFTFTPTSASALLSFLAGGTPAGSPPFTLLDGVTLHALPWLGASVPAQAHAPLGASPAPEPASWAMMIVGFGAVGASLRRRRRAVARAAA